MIKEFEIQDQENYISYLHSHQGANKINHEVHDYNFMIIHPTK